MHKRSYLSHFFTPITSELIAKSEWEIGYYNPETQKITIFVKTENSFMVKQEDEVFKKETSNVDELGLSDITEFEDASSLCKQNLAKLFPKEKLGDGFVILQNFEEKIQWNFTFVTASLKFANVKISAVTGKIDSNQLVEAVTREK